MPGMAAEVEAALATRQTPAVPPQYADAVALASLIVAIATLAWTVYTDLRKRTTAIPAPDVITGTVRVTLRESSQAVPPDRVIDVVVTARAVTGARVLQAWAARRGRGAGIAPRAAPGAVASRA
jgi:hypothetical protein